MFFQGAVAILHLEAFNDIAAKKVTLLRSFCSSFASSSSFLMTEKVFRSSANSRQEFWKIARYSWQNHLRKNQEKANVLTQTLKVAIPLNISVYRDVVPVTIIATLCLQFVEKDLIQSSSLSEISYAFNLIRSLAWGAKPILKSK